MHPKSCPAQHAVTVAPRAHADSKSVRANQLIGYGAKEGTRGMTIVRQDAADFPRWKYLPSVNLCSSRVGAMQPNQSWTTTALRWACVLPMRTRTNKAQQTRKTLGNFAMSFEIVARPPVRNAAELPCQRNGQQGPKRIMGHSTCSDKTRYAARACKRCCRLRRNDPTRTPRNDTHRRHGAEPADAVMKTECVLERGTAQVDVRHRTCEHSTVGRGPMNPRPFL